MGNNAKKFMGAPKGNKIPIKKMVTRGGKSFQQTFYVSPQEAMMMQRKARKQMTPVETAHKTSEKKKPVKRFVESSNKILEEARLATLYDKWRTPLGGDPKKVLPEPPPPSKHIEIARKALGSHRQTLNEKISSLRELAPPGSKVKGRVKEVESAVGKVQRKPKYGTANNLQDLTGTRVVMNTSQEVLDTVKRLHERYEILGEDDYITPMDQREFANEGLRKKAEAVMGGGYRSYHMIAKDKRGNAFEIQLRTQGQNSHAEWAHDVYKPVTSAQSEYLKKHSKELNDYGRMMSSYFTEKETNSKLQAPPCPTVVAGSPFGCMEA